MGAEYPGVPVPDWFRFVVTRCGWCGGESCTCPPVRVEPCACGGDIRARYGDERGSVRRHNQSERHQSWRASHE